MKTTSLSLLAGAVLALCVPATASANLVRNGSFEFGTFSNSPTGNSWDTSVNSQQFRTGDIVAREWSVIGNQPSDDIAWIGKNHVYGQLTASDGNNFLDLTGWQQGGVAGKGVAQTFSGTILGQRYIVSFDLGNSTAYNTGNNALRVRAGNLDQVVTSLTSNSGNSWDHFSFEFVATGATTLSFTGVQANNYIGLDNVSVTAVPEPETYALLLAGLGVMGAVARRRKSQQA